jgi:hypothetical protein
VKEEESISLKMTEVGCCGVEFTKGEVIDRKEAYWRKDASIYRIHICPTRLQIIREAPNVGR